MQYALKKSWLFTTHTTTTTNNNNFPGCTWTRRHSQIRKKDQDPSIFICPARTIDVRQGRIPIATKWGK